MMENEIYETPSDNPKKVAILVLPLIAYGEQTCPQCKRLGLKPISSAPTLIGPGEEFVFSTRPQDVFKPTQLIIAGENLEGLYILDIKIGNISQVSGNGSLPVPAFANKEISPPISIDCAQVSQDVSVRIKNASNEPKVCEPFFIGRVVRF